MITFSCLVQLSTCLPFSFPDGSRSASSTSTAQRRQEAFEGRSIRGNGGGSSSKNQFPDIYSRYQVHENDPDPPGVRPTAGPFLDRPGSITPPPPRYTTRSDRPNASFNRLPPTKNDEPIQAEPAIDYDDGDEEDVGEEEEQPDKPVTAASAPLYRPSVGSYGGGGSNTFNNIFTGFNDKFGGGLGGGLTSLFGENRHKFKLKRRKPGQPCIPYSLFHKLRYGRDLQGNPVDPKTLLPHLNLVLADVNYFAPNNNYGGGGGGGSVDFHSDTGTGGAVFNNHFYDAVGGYPCQGVSFGGGLPHKPFKPHRPHGGPLGFFGQGGLFDWVSSADQVQGDEGVGETGGTSGNRPTVVFNLNDAIDSVATNWRPGESFQMMMGVIANFITQVAGTAAAPVADVATDVRKINREFFSLFG
uniref:Uncharacterized protein n=1 Tax=Anopheles stephensi TaxID=30069 RepID=A0A182YGQ0_ANOST